MLSRRAVILNLPAATLIASSAFPVLADDKSVTIGINLPLTGADAHDAELIKDGALLALDEANAQGGVAEAVEERLAPEEELVGLEAEVVAGSSWIRQLCWLDRTCPASQKERRPCTLPGERSILRISSRLTRH